MTLVRAVLELEKMGPGEVLEILTDHEPASVNLPRTLAREGQGVLQVERAGEAQWRLLVRKDGTRRR